MAINISKAQLKRAAEALIAKNAAIIQRDDSEDDQWLAEMDEERDAEYRQEIDETPAEYRLGKLKLIWEGFIRPVIGVGDPDQYAFDKWDAEWTRITKAIQNGELTVDDLLVSLEHRQPIRRSIP